MTRFPWRLAWREIRNDARFSVLFVLNLGLGLLGFVSLDAFREGLDRSLHSRSKTLLGADLSVSARRPLTAAEWSSVEKILPPGSRVLRVVEMYSMVAGRNGTRLVQLKAVEPGYPFYGALDRSGGEGELAGRPVVWAYPEILPQLGLEEGGEIRLGTAAFRVEDTILGDPTNAWAGATLAPRLYLSLEQLDRTGLLRKGSTAFHSRLVKLPAEADAEALARELERTLTDPGIRVSTHRSASEAVGRLLDYLADYLGLVALVGLFLSGLGAAFLFRTYLSRRLKEVAILQSLGLPPRGAQGVFLRQLALLGLLCAVPVLVGAWALLPPIGHLAARFIPWELPLALSPRSAALALVMAVGGSLAICFPLLLRVRTVKPGLLLREGEEVPPAPLLPTLLAWSPAAAVYYGLAVWQAHSFRVGSLFVGGFLGATALLALVGWGIIPRLAVAFGQGRLGWRLAARSLARHRFATAACFLALGLGMVLLNLIPQLQRSLQTELDPPTGSSLPSLFLFDIQEEQEGPLLALLRENGVEPGPLSALVRARIDGVNGEPFVKGSANERAVTREEEREMRFRNRGFNLTYRPRLSEAETLVEGRDFSGVYDPDSGRPAEISLETRFAERLGFRIGDRLKFDVEGVAVEGEIVNFRRVRWTSFQPNFFVQFQEGVLEEAPKTFLLSVPDLPAERKLALQNRIVGAFPNVSMVDVSRVVERIQEIILQMSWALKAMAVLAVLAGFLVLFSVLSHQLESRRVEINLVKVLGAPFRLIQGSLWLEFLALAVAAGLLGAAVGLAFSYGLSRFLFESLWAGSWTVPVVTTSALVALTMAVVWITSRRVLGQRPVTLLREAV